MRRLLEWVSAPPKATSAAVSYKEKFEKLLDYHKKHRAHFVTRSEIKYIRDDGFHYVDHVKHTGEEFDHDVVVKITKIDPSMLPGKNEHWTISVFKDGNHVLDKSHYGTGYEDLVNNLRDSLVIPLRGSSDYDNLIESINSFADDFQLYENLWTEENK